MARINVNDTFLVNVPDTPDGVPTVTNINQSRSPQQNPNNLTYNADNNPLNSTFVQSEDGAGAQCTDNLPYDGTQSPDGTACARPRYFTNQRRLSFSEADSPKSPVNLNVTYAANTSRGAAGGGARSPSPQQQPLNLTYNADNNALNVTFAQPEDGAGAQCTDNLPYDGTQSPDGTACARPRYFTNQRRLSFSEADTSQSPVNLNVTYAAGGAQASAANATFVRGQSPARACSPRANATFVRGQSPARACSPGPNATFRVPQQGQAAANLTMTVANRNAPVNLTVQNQADSFDETTFVKEYTRNAPDLGSDSCEGMEDEDEDDSGDEDGGLMGGMIGILVGRDMNRQNASGNRSGSNRSQSPSRSHQEVSIISASNNVTLRIPRQSPNRSRRDSSGFSPLMSSSGCEDSYSNFNPPLSSSRNDDNNRRLPRSFNPAASSTQNSINILVSPTKKKKKRRKRDDGCQ